MGVGVYVCVYMCAAYVNIILYLVCVSVCIVVHYRNLHGLGCIPAAKFF